MCLIATQQRSFWYQPCRNAGTSMFLQLHTCANQQHTPHVLTTSWCCSPWCCSAIRQRQPVPGSQQGPGNSEAGQGTGCAAQAAGQVPEGAAAAAGGTAGGHSTGGAIRASVAGVLYRLLLCNDTGSEIRRQFVASATVHIHNIMHFMKLYMTSWFLLLRDWDLPVAECTSCMCGAQRTAWWLPH